MRYLFVLLLLAGCASTSEVMEVGKDRYMVSATDRGSFRTWDDAKGTALKKATEHCGSLGRRMEASSWETRGAPGWTRFRAELTYRCVEK